MRLVATCLADARGDASVPRRWHSMSALEEEAPAASLVLSVAAITDRHLLNKGLLRVSKAASKQARPLRPRTLRGSET